jgi:hypothetical protein
MNTSALCPTKPEQINRCFSRGLSRAELVQTEKSA